VNRANLPSDPAAALTMLEQRIADLHDQRSALMHIRAQIRREIVETGHGGVARLAKAAHVSHPAAGRQLANDLLRAIRAAAQQAGLSRDDYQLTLTSQAYPPRAQLLPTGPADIDALLTALRATGQDVDVHDQKIMITW
jgi:hypothetical protein